MPISDALYDKSSIKIISKMEKMSEDTSAAIQANAAATAGITESINTLTEAVKELTETVKSFKTYM